MGVALYRKYRSKSLAEIVGQEHITQTLDNALKHSAISHAYLFTGPRGVGKTSIARILAHEVNDLLYDETVTHMDIIEIDAASNRGIEEIRDLREKVHTAPSIAKYKVYIIDEVHMLTTPAFNALLKTLEEPPSHVIFVLATTESHKLPDTIVSRCMRFNFRPIDPEKVISHLKTISQAEDISISDEALQLIAQHGDGSFRDSISLLDQASNKTGNIELNDILNLLGMAPADVVRRVLRATLESSTSDLMGELSSIKEYGYHSAGFAKQLGLEVRQRLLNNKLSVEAGQAITLLRQLLKIPSAHDPEALLEITLIGLNLELQSAVSSKKPSAKSPAPKERTPSKTANLEPVELPVVIKKTEKTANGKTNLNQPETTDIWPQVLDTIKSRHNTLYGILRMARPTIDNNALTLKFSFAFHQKKINEPQSKRIISDIVEDIAGTRMSVLCLVAEPETSKQNQRTTGDLESITSIFGTAEVLE